MNRKDISYINSEAFSNGSLKEGYRCIIKFSIISCVGNHRYKVYGFEKDNIIIDKFKRHINITIKTFFETKLKKYKLVNTATISNSIDTLERILRYQENDEEYLSTGGTYIRIQIYKNNNIIYEKLYTSRYSHFDADVRLLSFNTLLERCIDKRLDNDFIQNEKLKYEKKQRYIVDRFIQSLPISNQHQKEFGLALYTSINKELFYIYKDNNDKVFISPKKGQSQFSVSRKNIENIFINKELIKSTNDKAYILPICQFLIDYIGENINFIDMPAPNPFRTKQVEYKISNEYKEFQFMKE